MRAHVMVVVAPRLDDLARFAQPDEYVFVEAFIAQPAVKGFDECILDRVCGELLVLAESALSGQSCGSFADR